jgi:exopolysaccharide transport family protein
MDMQMENTALGLDQSSHSKAEPGESHRMNFSFMQQDVGVHDLLNILYRRKWVIVGAVVGALLLATILLSLFTPRYKAEALLMIESRQPTIPTVESVLSGITADEEGVRSEVEVVRSRSLMAVVAEKLNLHQDPEFNKALKDPGADQAGSVSSVPGAPGVVDALLKRLQVTPIKNSRVISVAFSSVEPAKAASIANTLLDEYLIAQIEAKFEAAKMANSWVTERIDELRDQVTEAESAVEDFRRNAGLLQTDGITLTAQQMAELNAQLILARAASAEAEVRLQQLARLLDSDDGVATASEVLDSPLIQRLREQQTQVERRVAELAAEYGPSHPRMIQLNAEAEDLESNIAAEVNKIAKGLENEVAYARARESSLESELGALKASMADANDKEIQLRALEREAEAARTLLSTLLARNKEISSQDDEMQAHRADARIVSRAEAPQEPYFPQTKVILGIAGLLSGLLSLILVFVLELRQRGFISGEQIEATTDIPALGFVPTLQMQGPNKDEEPIDYIVSNPRSALAQAHRTLFWSLSLMTPLRLNSVVVTSALPEEGKTMTATGLARMQALAGRKTLLIDADARNPQVQKVLGESLEPGLMNILKGNESNDIIASDSATGLDFLTAGEISEDPMALLASQAMQDFLADMCEIYDLVVIDTPPVMAASDACALGRLTDTTVMVVRWSKTPRETVMHSLRQLQRADAFVAGALLTYNLQVW